MSHSDPVENRASPIRNYILLGQLGSNGDCLYATAVARQIKQDFPGCHLTWAISSLCRQVIEENPFVDQIWEIPTANWQSENLQRSWHDFESEALKRYDLGQYSFVFFTQISLGNPHHYDGTIRPGIFRGYPGKITVPLSPYLKLRSDETEAVSRFAVAHGLTSYDRVILFECASKSGQSPLNPERALEIAEGIVGLKMEKVAIILCSQQAVHSSYPEIIDGSILSLRQMAELTKYCHLLMGCSSGISCICTSTWAKPLPMIQLLDHRWAIYGSLAHDYEYFGLSQDHVTEMYDDRWNRIFACYQTLVRKGWKYSRSRFSQRPKVRLSHYLSFLKQTMVASGDFYGVCVSLETTTRRYGWKRRLKSYVRKMAKKYLKAPLDYKQVLKAQFPGSWFLYLNQSRWVGRIIMRKSSRNDQEKRYQKGSPQSIDAIVFALYLFEHGEFSESYHVLTKLRGLNLTPLCLDLEWLYADLCWICGHLQEASKIYRDCLRREPDSPKLIRLIRHLTDCMDQAALRDSVPS
jgi:hypothetical protein